MSLELLLVVGRRGVNEIGLLSNLLLLQTKALYLFKVPKYSQTAEKSFLESSGYRSTASM
jgi:hypothetical protein